ncbi:MAG TPA: tRNA uridine-5-carboxymethylaminomethyl(34) synthesis GTPase MnmE, partial [Clostridia bacterium]|nr:tRNA uridine-5-carboxymethylaminomethyl(34) synthesis GTPase MnmE [Clostridia bacterium]
MSTICAISTSLAEAAIGIVRLSGPASLSIANRIFKGGDLEKKPRYLHYGHIYRADSPIDEVLAVYFRAPYTYTREDMVEINTHGGAMALQRVLALCLEEGARLANPGEFTQRAFLNGRLDLPQAEAVMQLIQAKTELGYDLALTHLEGDISKKLRQIREILLSLLASISLAIDYPEEDEEEISYEKLIDGMEKVYKE